MSPTRLRATLAAFALLLAGAASAQEFSAIISPPRFEGRAQAGQTYRQVVEVVNPTDRSTRLSVSTADWTLDGSYTPVFSQALAPGSCRPWVGIEASEIRLPPGGRRRFRFEVAVPADAPRGQCRFALMFEGDPSPPTAGVPLPVSGRIGVIVYLTLGDAAPALVVLGTRVVQAQGQALPQLDLRNDGDMHARLEGFLAGVDAAGQRIVLVPDNSPILAGMSRGIPLYPQPERAGDAVPAIRFPLRIKGRLDTDGQRLDIDATVAE